MGTFVPRLVTLTLIWLFATAALTYAAGRHAATPAPATTTTAAAAPTAPATLVVPDVRRQAFVFAKGTLADSGFSWRVEGAVRGFAANTVATQSPAAGTKVVDTGSPLVVVHLERTGKESGIPEDVSAVPGTRVKLAELALADAPAVVTAPKKITPVVKKKAVVKVKKAPVKKAAVKRAPVKKAPKGRPPAFAVAGARREPLDEIPLPVRADRLLGWVGKHPQPTDANVRYWLFQHAWIVSGARMGWWHGSAALHTLLQVDQRVWDLWGIGARSERQARKALAEVQARSA
jgi:PASTA domain